MVCHSLAAGLNQPIRNENPGFERDEDMILSALFLTVCSVLSISRKVLHILQIGCFACASSVHAHDM